MENRKITCISCPLGCELSVEFDSDTVNVTGNRCPRGAEYAINEIRNPKRVVTSNVRVVGGKYPLASVKTTGAIPKERIFDLIEKLKDISLEAPVKIGQIVYSNLFDTGFDVVVTRPIEKSN
ncbi:MAG TPA: DUF1667 domain-containing protein [Thermotogota bacterium]|mgnify:CR=1 FL=1|nr:DUF1667 domain-containing protein [Thermotogota bacterium]HPJ87537.1 DUF1667 domain-containing protein [Thermotogota bacterium]HPR94742.1 DUF1667 domain-containing protein [Thermotogota bacterium]